MPDPTPRGWASLSLLSPYQWFVFAVAATAWVADCMDQQLFNLARRSSLVDLTGGDMPRVELWSSVSTAVFLVGWAAGGLGFGVYGDRLGRVRTLTATVLLYSVFTGLSAASQGVWDYSLYRLLTGVGVGGVFAAAVALLAESMPAAARPFTLGLMQALSTIGNCTAAGLFILLGLLELNGHLEPLRAVGLNAWRTLFLIGLAPALLVVIIQRRLHEPQVWQDAKAAADAGTGPRLGSYADLFGGGWVTRHTLLGLVLAAVGVVALWGVAFFSIDLQQKVFGPVYAAEAAAQGLTGADAARYVNGQRIIWAGVTSFALNVGGFFGMTAFSSLTDRVGRKPAFAVGFVAAAASVALLFLFMKTRTDVVWMSALMGFCVLALFGGYAIWLPELFPTRLRATGTSFCYNVGRFVAASGPLALGGLTAAFAGAGGPDGGPDLPSRYAGVAMCSVFLVGLAVLPFLPETKGQPLPT